MGFLTDGTHTRFDGCRVGGERINFFGSLGYQLFIYGVFLGVTHESLPIVGNYTGIPYMDQWE